MHEPASDRMEKCKFLPRGIFNFNSNHAWLCFGDCNVIMSGLPPPHHTLLFNLINNNCN